MEHLRKKLFAYFMLAVQLVVHLVRAPFRRTGLPKFQENYAPDGIFALTAEQRSSFDRFSRCIHCGLCDTYCAGLRGAPRALPSVLAIAESRSLPDLDASVTAAERFLGCEACGACEAACPTGVPLRELAAFVRAHGRPGPRA